MDRWPAFWPAAGLLVSQGNELGGGQSVVAVAHNMGGNALTRAAQQAPGLFAHAVYLAAFVPDPCAALASSTSSITHRDNHELA